MIGRLDDPFASVRADLRQVYVLVVQKGCHGHRLFDEGYLVGIEEGGRAFVEQHREDLLVVDDMSREAADERNALGAHGINELLRLVPMIDHVVRHAASPYRIDALSGAIAQNLAVEGQIAYVGYRAGHSATLERLCVEAELVHHAVLQVIDDGNARVVDASRVGCVDVHKRIHPAFE